MSLFRAKSRWQPKLLVLFVFGFTNYMYITMTLTAYRRIPCSVTRHPATTMHRNTSGSDGEVNRIQRRDSPADQRLASDSEQNMKYRSIWDWANQVITAEELFPEAPEVNRVLWALATAKIVSVDVVTGSGTSEKWVAVLEGGQKVMMKLVWRNKGKAKPNDDCNADFESPTSEIAAFHLHRLLGFRNVPYVSGRRVDLLREVLPVAAPSVSKQIVTQDNQTCVVGKWYNQDDNYTLCPHGGIVEASVAYWVPRLIKQHAHRGYMPYSIAHIKQWRHAGFNNKTYCQWFQKNQRPYEHRRYYYDVFDFSVMDTIMFHMDSKHYTIEDGSEQQGLTVKLDHGRAFCAIDKDDVHIYPAPVEQCCTLRKSTWHRLDAIRGGLLSTALQESMHKDPIAPILEEAWYPVLERRLKIVLDIIERCATANSWENVLV